MVTPPEHISSLPLDWRTHPYDAVPGDVTVTDALFAPAVLYVTGAVCPLPERPSVPLQEYEEAVPVTDAVQVTRSPTKGAAGEAEQDTASEADAAAGNETARAARMRANDAVEKRERWFMLFF